MVHGADESAGGAPVFVTCPPLSTIVLPAGRRPAAIARPHPVPASGVLRGLYVVAGVANVGLAYVGVVVPGIPATPFVLTASYCFSKSSPRLGRWLKASPLLGRFLRDWDEHRGIRRPVKAMAVCLVAAVVTTSIVFFGLPVWVKCAMGGMAAVGLCTIVFAVPTVENRPPT